MNKQSENKATSKVEISEKDLDKVSGGIHPKGVHLLKTVQAQAFPDDTRIQNDGPLPTGPSPYGGR
jgi:hypothetical protein